MHSTSELHDLHVLLPSATPPLPPPVTRLLPNVQATGSGLLKAGDRPLHSGVESLDYEVGAQGVPLKGWDGRTEGCRRCAGQPVSLHFTP